MFRAREFRAKNVNNYIYSFHVTTDSCGVSVKIVARGVITS